MEREGRQHDPYRDHSQPGGHSESLSREDQCPKHGIEEDEQLIAKQLELNQSLTRHGAREEEGYFGGGEREHPTLHSENPPPGHRSHQSQGSQKLECLKVGRCPGGSSRSLPN